MQNHTKYIMLGVTAIGSALGLFWIYKRNKQAEIQAQVSKLCNEMYEWQVQGDLDKVIQICDTILQLDPTNLPAFLLQTGYQDKKKPTAVSKDQILIQQNVSKYPNTQLFQEYIAKFADKYPAIYLLFFQFLLSPQITMEQVVECNKYADALIAHPLASPLLLSIAWSVKGSLCKSADEFASMETYNLISLSKYPKNNIALSTLTELYSLAGDFTKSLEYAERAIEVNSSNIMLRFIRAKSLFMGNQIPQAQSDLEEYLPKAGEVGEFYELLALLYFVQSERDKGLAVLDLGIERCKENLFYLGRLQHVKATSLMAFLQLEEALTLLKEVQKQVDEPAELAAVKFDIQNTTNMLEFMILFPEVAAVIEKRKKSSQYPLLPRESEKLLNSMSLPISDMQDMSEEDRGKCYSMLAFAHFITTTGTDQHNEVWLMNQDLMQPFHSQPFEQLTYCCSNAQFALVVSRKILALANQGQQFLCPQVAASVNRAYTEAKLKNVDPRLYCLSVVSKM